MSRPTFYTVTFIDAEGRHQVSRTFATVRMARKSAAHISKFGTHVRVMRGGPGGMEVSMQ